jgi:hypothetical protein
MAWQNGKFIPEEAIGQQYKFADDLSNQKWAPTWAGVLAGGLAGIGSGIHRNSAQNALQGNQSLMAQTLRGVGDAKTLDDAQKTLMSSEVPTLQQSGAESRLKTLSDDPNKEYRVRAAQWLKMGYTPETAGYKEFVLTGEVPDAAEQQYRNERLAIEREKISANRKDTDTRLMHLERLGVDPNSAEGITYLANGRLPAEFYKNQAQEARKRATAPKIAEGLANLNRMTTQYNDPAFLNSLGSVQGSTPDGLIDKALINTGRLYGEIANWYEGGNATPNEVRNNVTGATEALAAAIKPLIRAPGEGVWTDADQARLVAIVGDLPQASTKEEFKRRLNDVRNRIQSNFGLEIPFDAFGAQPTTQGDSSSQAINDARRAIEMGASREAVIQRLRENGIDPSGL